MANKGVAAIAAVVILLLLVLLSVWVKMEHSGQNKPPIIDVTPPKLPISI